MGVHGLWQLISSTGKPVPLESLEGKILAIDVSVWLHQLSKGMRDSAGNPVPYAHLHGLFTRICKLLFYRIKPVFVFDGGVPTLKKQTLASRRSKKDDAEKTSSLMQQKILTNLIRSQALKETLGDESLPTVPSLLKTSAKGNNKDAMFELPPLPERAVQYLSQHNNEEEKFDRRRELQQLVEDEFDDLDDVDVDSDDFRALPPEIQHEIITDLKERRKNGNVSKVVDMPEDSKEFSSFQMAKLLKHSKLSSRLVNVRKELNQRQTHDLSKHYGDNYFGASVHSQRVASEDASHYVLIKGLKNKKKKDHIERKKKKEVKKLLPFMSEESSNTDELLIDSDKDERENLNFMEVNQTKIMEKMMINQTKSCDIAGLMKTVQKDVNVHRGPGGENQQSTSELKEDKPIYRPVIEIESDTESSDNESDVKVVTEEIMTPNPSLGEVGDMMLDDNNDVIMEDLQSNRDLQLAIEQSLKEQKLSAVRRTTQGKVKQLIEKPIKSHKVSKKSDEKVPDKLLTKLSKNENKDITADKLDKVKDDIKADEEINANASDIKKTFQIFKRQVSCLSNGSEGNASKKIKIVIDTDSEAESDHELEEKGPETVYQAGDDESERIDISESEDEFIEVKIDLETVKEDSLFPASMFEANTSVDTEGDEMEGDEMEAGIKINHDNVDTAVPVDDSNHSDVEVQQEEEAKQLTGEREQLTGEPEKLTGEPVLAEDSPVNFETEQEVEVTQDNDYVPADVVMETASTPDVVSGDNMPDIVEDTYRKPENPRIPDLVKAFGSLSESVRGMRDNIAQETRQLQQERGRQERLAMSITDQMHSEAQELLQLFGIPYIVSPTEAEAQCAQLELLNLTHGTITDDSDIWLFGGKCVFKNFFNLQKHVECFKDVNITSKLGLTRETLINIAFLCGSDYTEGIQGVGPVTAMEILAEFPGEGLEGLVKLKSWWEEAQKQIRVPVVESKLRNKLRDLDIRAGFPNPAVAEAYLTPTVDESTDKFTWSLPDMDQLRQFASDKLGWTRDKTDENLLPVMKQLGQKQLAGTNVQERAIAMTPASVASVDTQMQRKISSFFQPEVYMQPVKMKSKRLQKAVTQFINPQAIGEEPELPDTAKQTNKRASNALVPARNRRRGRKPKGQEEESVCGENKQSADNRDVESVDVLASEKNKTQKGEAGKRDDLGKTCTTSEYFEPRTKSNVQVTGKTSDMSSDSESDPDSSASFESNFESLPVTSDDETTVIETGLNIADILKMTMGDKAENIISNTTNTKASNMLRVFESGLNVTELMSLEGCDKAEALLEQSDDENDFDEDSNDTAEDVQISHNGEDKHGDEDGDDDDGNIDLFENEGGFVREENMDNDFQNTDPKSEIEKSSTSLTDEVNSKKPSMKDAQHSNGRKRKINEDNKSFEKNVAQPKRQKRSIKTESSSRNNISEISQGLESMKNQEGMSTNNSNDLIAKSGNSKNAENKLVEKLQTKVDAFENSSKAKAIVEPMKSKKSYSEKLIKTEAQQSLTNEPIKPMVTGVPWADKGKQKRKSRKGKGPAKGSIRVLTPVNKFQKKGRTKKTLKNPIGCINLSESDSDISN